MTHGKQNRKQRVYHNAEIQQTEYPYQNTVNPLYTDIRYSDKTRYNDN